MIKSKIILAVLLSAFAAVSYAQTTPSDAAASTPKHSKHVKHNKHATGAASSASGSAK